MRKNARQVIAEVAKKHGLTVVEILSMSRARSVAWPRQEAMFEVFVQCPHLSLPQMGFWFGGMDHTTILHGVRAHCERIGEDYETVKMTCGRTGQREPSFRIKFAKIADRYDQAMQEARRAASV